MSDCPSGMGTVIKAARVGELAGVGKLGVAGKTTCPHFRSRKQCAPHPGMVELVTQYSRPFGERDYGHISALVEAAVQIQDGAE